MRTAPIGLNRWRCRRCRASRRTARAPAWGRQHERTLRLRQRAGNDARGGVSGRQLAVQPCLELGETDAQVLDRLVGLRRPEVKIRLARLRLAEHPCECRLIESADAVERSDRLGRAEGDQPRADPRDVCLVIDLDLFQRNPRRVRTSDQSRFASTFMCPSSVSIAPTYAAARRSKIRFARSVARWSRETSNVVAEPAIPTAAVASTLTTASLTWPRSPSPASP